MLGEEEREDGTGEETGGEPAAVQGPRRMARRDQLRGV